MNPSFRKLLDRKMSRKEFLTFGTVLVGSMFGIVGVIKQLASHAATATGVAEAENGTVSSAATTVVDSKASGASAVKFGSGVTSGGGDTAITHGIQLTKAMVGHTAYFDSSLGRKLTDADLTAGAGSSTSAGQVIYKKVISGGFDVNHDNVTLRGCWIQGEIVTNDNAGLILDHCEIGPRDSYNPGTYDVGVLWSNYTATRCYVHNFSDGFHPNGNTTLTECYVDGQENTDPEGHHDSIQMTEGSNVTMTRCHVVNNNGETSGIQLGSDQGPIDNVLIKDCYAHISWSSQSGYALYPGDSNCTRIFIEGFIADSALGDSRAIHSTAYPASGHMTGCSYSDGTTIPNLSWGGL